MLSRLVPFFPFKLSNYFFGLTRFSLRGLVFGTLVGIIPFSVHNVYLGAIAADLATLGTRTAHRTPLERLRKVSTTSRSCSIMSCATRAKSACAVAAWMREESPKPS